MGERPDRATTSAHASLATPAKTVRHAEPDQWVRMTVSYTVEQYEWLRRQAFEQRTTIASVLRRCVDECREPGGAGAVADPVPRQGGDGGSPMDGDMTSSRDWVRLSVSFTPEQHAWLWRRAFEERTTLARLVRRYVADARAALRSRPQPGAPVAVLRMPGQPHHAVASGPPRA